MTLRKPEREKLVRLAIWLPPDLIEWLKGQRGQFHKTTSQVSAFHLKWARDLAQRTKEEEP